MWYNEAAMVPQSLKRFFWDTPIQAIDVQRNKRYVISRVLELGDEAAVAWLERVYTQSDLRETVAHSRLLSPKSRNYWKIKYGLAHA